jgi:hypothetical protein
VEAQGAIRRCARLRHQCINLGLHLIQLSLFR